MGAVKLVTFFGFGFLFGAMVVMKAVENIVDQMVSEE